LEDATKPGPSTPVEGPKKALDKTDVLKMEVRDGEILGCMLAQPNLFHVQPGYFQAEVKSSEWYHLWRRALERAAGYPFLPNEDLNVIGDRKVAEFQTFLITETAAAVAEAAATDLFKVAVEIAKVAAGPLGDLANPG